MLLVEIILYGNENWIKKMQKHVNHLRQVIDNLLVASDVYEIRRFELEGKRWLGKRKNISSSSKWNKP